MFGPTAPAPVLGRAEASWLGSVLRLPVVWAVPDECTKYCTALQAIGPDTPLIVASTQCQLCTNFARNLKRLRIERGLSQEQLAEIASVSRSFIAQIEIDKLNVTLQKVELLAQALGVAPLAMLSQG